MEVPIGEEDLLDEDEDDDEIDEQGDDIQREPSILLDVSKHTQRPGALAVSQHGTIYLTTENGVLIANRRDGVLGTIAIGEDDAPTAVALGGDGYLYVASSHKLYRIRTKEKPVQLPTNKVVRPPKSLKN